MNCCKPIIATNAGGIPYFSSTNVNIGTDNININLGSRIIPPAGYLTIIISDAIPTTATTTLPVSLTLNGITKALTLPNGTPVTAAELVGVKAIQVLNSRPEGILLLMSRTTV